jgi:hypothetical protein
MTDASVIVKGGARDHCALCVPVLRLDKQSKRGARIRVGRVPPDSFAHPRSAVPSDDPFVIGRAAVFTPVANCVPPRQLESGDGGFSIASTIFRSKVRFAGGRFCDQPARFMVYPTASPADADDSN